MSDDRTGTLGSSGSQGDEDGGFVAITSGDPKGERVVTRGAFDIHLAALMGTVESHRH